MLDVATHTCTPIAVGEVEAGTARFYGRANALLFTRESFAFWFVEDFKEMLMASFGRRNWNWGQVCCGWARCVGGWARCAVDGPGVLVDGYASGHL